MQVTEGTLVRSRPICIQATSANTASFSVTGGLGYVALTISGLSGYADPVLFMSTDGQTWVNVNQSVYGKDFWQADFDFMRYGLRSDTDTDILKIQFRS